MTDGNRGDAVTSSYSVVMNGQAQTAYIDGLEATPQVHLNASNSFMAYATAYVPASLIAGNTLTTGVRRVDGPGPAYLSEIQVAQGDRRYIDCGAVLDLAHDPTNRPSGHLDDGFALSTNGATPVTSIRYDYDGSVRYRFSSLQSDSSYVLFATLWEGDGVGRVQRISVDGSVVSDPVSMGDGASHVVTAFVSSNAVADGQLDVTIERTNGADVQVSILELNEWTQAGMVMADADGDGMPNAFEVANQTSRHGNTPLDPGSADAYADSDGDGMSNLDEYLAGTDPLDPNSKLQVVAIAQGEPTGAGFVITWQAAKFKHYRIDFCNDLTRPIWYPVEDNVQALADGPMQWADAAGTRRNTSGAYRVILLEQ